MRSTAVQSIEKVQYNTVKQHSESYFGILGNKTSPYSTLRSLDSWDIPNHTNLCKSQIS